MKKSIISSFMLTLTISCGYINATAQKSAAFDLKSLVKGVVNILIPDSPQNPPQNFPQTPPPQNFPQNTPPQTQNFPQNPPLQTQTPPQTQNFPQNSPPQTQNFPQNPPPQTLPIQQPIYPSNSNQPGSYSSNNTPFNNVISPTIVIPPSPPIIINNNTTR